MSELRIVLRGSVSAHFSHSPFRADLRVRESKVALTPLGRQSGGEWYGLVPRTQLDSLRCVTCFVVVCLDLFRANTLIVFSCALMILCSRWRYIGPQ